MTRRTMVQPAQSTMTKQLQPQQQQDLSSWTEFVPGTAWCVDHLLTDDECQRLVDAAQKQGIEDLQFKGDTRHRQRVRVTLSDHNDGGYLPDDIVSKLWERVKDKIPQEIVINSESLKHDEAFRHVAPSDCIIGRWTPSRLHPSVNVARCMGKGHLAAHRDAEIIVSEHERSLLTINGYLTDRPAGSGGATRFLKEEMTVTGADITVDDEKDVLYRVESDKAGKAVVFIHGLVHDGEPLVEGSPEKWIFRSSVYYQRDPETAPKRTPEEIEARKLLKQAEEAEESGLISKAIALYSKAYRLDPSLE